VVSRTYCLHVLGVKRHSRPGCGFNAAVLQFGGVSCLGSDSQGGSHSFLRRLQTKVDRHAKPMWSTATETMRLCYARLGARPGLRKVLGDDGYREYMHGLAKYAASPM
jgi:hypothetical protein